MNQLKHFDTLVQRLVEFNIPSPRLEARLLLAHILDKNHDDVSIINAELNEEQVNQLEDLVVRRTINHEPLDKILGKKGFYKYEFIVDGNVLSPRPDTEILLEEAIYLSKDKALKILDLGTGSGCILLSLLKENIQLEGVGVDISTKALDVAQKNAIALSVANQVKWVNADWFDENFLDKINAKFDMIISNPPYIPNKDIIALDPEVKNHDPMLALSGGEDGYDSYQRIAELTPYLLKDEGYILLECGIEQFQKVADIFIKNKLSLHKIVKDLQNIERCVILKK